MEQQDQVVFHAEHNYHIMEVSDIYNFIFIFVSLY